jgi:hypothetical protein
MTPSSAQVEDVTPESASPESHELPAWVIDELPPQYGEIARQIATLKEDARKYEGIAAVVWETRQRLTLAVRDLFAALKFETELMSDDAHYDLAVDLGEGRRLLVDVVGGSDALDKRSPEIQRVLTALQQDAGSDDRVVVAANVFHKTPLKSRNQEPAAPDALRLIQGLGANLIETSTLFGLWRYSLEDLDGARESVMKLHSLDGGIFR